MDFNNNKEVKLAYEFVQFTNKNVFLTGKAGTGKTTFLHYIKNNSFKRMIVVAPTGVAAINASGVTIHSFFQLPFSPFIPENGTSNFPEGNNNIFKLRKNKIKIIKSLDLLIIDEISMVRADLLDAIDSVLRRYRNNNEPFGGVQVLMIGDLHQLSPVIKSSEWDIIKDYYDSVYFFGSNALKKTNFVTIELKKIYRQEDIEFIKILGEIRNNAISTQSIKSLNERNIKNFNDFDDDGYITLTTHNVKADEINNRKLNEIKGEIYKFEAELKGDFPEMNYPTAKELELKVGAQVMFIKNDSSPEKLFFNGKIGKIVSFEDDIIWVKCDDDYSNIPVSPEKWDNIKYKFNEGDKSIDEEVIGSFIQHPLKLAWAITVHKSQGLTFDKAILDINSSFAFGQVYVALSRCRSLQGLLLTADFFGSRLKSDSEINEFNSESENNKPDENKLELSKKEYQRSIIKEQFDFTDIRKNHFYLYKIIRENRIADNNISELFEKIKSNAERDIYNICEKFNKQLDKLFLKNTTPQDDDEVLERLSKASEYFLDKMEKVYVKEFQNVILESDNKEVNKLLKDVIERLEKEIFLKTETLKRCKNKFSTQEYSEALSIADLNFKPTFNKSDTSAGELKNENLQVILNNWRKMTAEEEGVPIFMVMPKKSMNDLIKKLPSNLKELGSVNGFGKVKIQKYGEDILEIINDYCIDNNIEREKLLIDDSARAKPKKKPKKKTDLISLEMFQEGKNINEIALERGFTAGTIIRHLLKYVYEGTIRADQLMDEKKYQEIYKAVLELHENIDAPVSLTDIYNKTKGEFSYDEIRICIAGLNQDKT